MPRRLTIAIPTYNRPEPLRQTLLALRPQANEDVELVVVDNASNPPVEPVVNEVMGGSAWAFRVIRNPVNIGLCANIFRCFEVGLGEWLWVLGDDDTVNPAAVDTIRRTIDEHPDLLFASYTQPVAPNVQDRICESVDAFFLALNSIPQIIFISTSLYNRRKVLPYLSLAYNFLDSGAAHSALLLLAGLDQQKQRLAYLTSNIACWQPPPPGETYSNFSSIGQHQLLSLCRASVRDHIARLLLKNMVSPIRLLVHLIRDALNGRNPIVLNAILNDYLQAYGKIRGGVVGFLLSTPIRLGYRLLLRFPRISGSILNFTFRLLRGKPMSYDPNPVSINSYQRLSETVCRNGTTNANGKTAGSA